MTYLGFVVEQRDGVRVVQDGRARLTVPAQCLTSVRPLPPLPPLSCSKRCRALTLIAQSHSQHHRRHPPPPPPRRSGTTPLADPAPLGGVGDVAAARAFGGGGGGGSSRWRGKLASALSSRHGFVLGT